MTSPSPSELASAVTREASWLATSGDGLPALLESDGGKWNIVQAYWPGNRWATQKTGIYVLFRSAGFPLPMAVRYRPQYLVTLRLVWPVRASTQNLAETEQQNFQDAITDLVQRINGPDLDKSHGGNFLSCAVVPEEMPLAVDWDDPEVTIERDKTLRATATYHIDDLEYGSG